MAIKFALRGDTLAAYYANHIGNNPGKINDLTTSFDPTILATTASDVIGGSFINIDNNTSTSNGLAYPGFSNTSNTITTSILIRFAMGFTGGNFGIFAVAGPGSPGNNAISVPWLTGALWGYAGHGDGTFLVNHATINPGITINEFNDLVIVHNGLATAGGFLMYLNGVTLSSDTPSNNMGERRQELTTSIILGQASQGFNSGRMKVNEFVIWDEVIDPNNITLVDASSGITSTGGSLNGGTRDSWVDVSQIDRGIWSSLTAGNIRTGFDQVQAGATITGTFSGEQWSTITAAQIASGINQIQNGTTITGTLSVPSPGTGANGTVDLEQIRSTIADILGDENTTTGSPINLSENLTTPVKKIYELSVEKIPVQPSCYPYVAISVARKDIEIADQGQNQLVSKRKARIDIDIMGGVWDSTMPTKTEDNADKEITYLMENIENILRANVTLRGLVDWAFPTDVAYHSVAIEEETHLRLSLMKFQLTLLY